MEIILVDPNLARIFFGNNFFDPDYGALNQDIYGKYEFNLQCRRKSSSNTALSLAEQRLINDNHSDRK